MQPTFGRRFEATSAASRNAAPQEDGAAQRVVAGSPVAPSKEHVSPGRIRVALLDALSFRREAVKQMLHRCVPEHEIVCYGTGEDLSAALSNGLADLGLVVVCTGGQSLSCPDLGAALRALCAELAPVPVVILSDREDDDDIVEACRVGVRGYLPTSLDPEVAREVLHLVSAGGNFLPAACVMRLLGGETGDSRELVTGSGTAAFALTPRQQEVLDLLCRGKPNKLIAHELGMEESTVKVHVRHLMRKLGASNRTEVLVRAQEMARPAEGSETGD